MMLTEQFPIEKRRNIRVLIVEDEPMLGKRAILPTSR